VHGAGLTVSSHPPKASVANAVEKREAVGGGGGVHWAGSAVEPSDTVHAHIAHTKVLICLQTPLEHYKLLLLHGADGAHALLVILEVACLQARHSEGVVVGPPVGALSHKALFAHHHLALQLVQEAAEGLQPLEGRVVGGIEGGALDRGARRADPPSDVVPAGSHMLWRRPRLVLPAHCGETVVNVAENRAPVAPCCWPVTLAACDSELIPKGCRGGGDSVGAAAEGEFAAGDGEALILLLPRDGSVITTLDLPAALALCAR